MDLRNLGMDLRSFGIDNALLSTIQDMLDMSEDHDNKGGAAQNNPSRAYVRDAKAMASTPADVKEYPNYYTFIVDMPGIKANEIKVQIEDDNVLVISGERKREKEDGVTYLRMERRIGKLMRKFSLPENANVDAISAVCQDGVTYLRMERRIGKLMRKFSLPENANVDAISAVCQDGVLTVTVQKLPPPEAKKPKTIEVKLG